MMFRFGRFETRSSLCRRVLVRSGAAARSDAVILVTGESGVGKTLLAEAVHDASLRREGPFVVVDGSSLEESILGGELFGHTSGAFTGALSARTGILEAARGGSVFLDEIDKLPLRAQGRLLRAIEAKRIRPLGENRERCLDVRFMCAANRPLRELVGREQFLSDLYHRISEVVVPVPPLRARSEDIPFLFGAFLTEERESNGREVPRLGEDAWSILMSYPWPGNVRELRQVARRLAIFCDGRIKGQDVREAIEPPVDMGRLAFPGRPS